MRHAKKENAAVFSCAVGRRQTLSKQNIPWPEPGDVFYQAAGYL
jgi:hypothetical protein